ncbi:MAG: TerB family tellurite resistance protein [SAR324 cluster bacterium]|nr:TerB family tellurite resistance protein [SAR324 cluster bacterium]
MVILEEKRKLRNQQKIKLTCEKNIFDFFDSAQGTILSMFPKTKLVADNKTSETDSFSLETEVIQQFKRRKQWIGEVFNNAIQISVSETYEELPIDSIHFIPKISHRLVRDLLKILSEGGNLSDNGLLYIGDIGNALGLETQEIDILIEQVQYERRKEFTQRLLELLTEDQSFWVALMLWKAIHIDEKVDYREYKYFENIIHLLSYEQKKLTSLKENHHKPIELPDPFFDARLCVQIYRYIVEIVMIDEEYTPKEAEFIQQIGNLFGYDKMQQDEIIQPVASAIMLRKSLFSY